MADVASLASANDTLHQWDVASDEPDLDFLTHGTNDVTHGLHPFAAKCPPPLVAWLIERWSQPGDTILDPMAGSGTTLIEAQLLERRSIGVELDPFSCLLCEVKTTALDVAELTRVTTGLLADVERRCARYDAGERDHMPRLPEFPRRDYWFLPEVSAKLAIIKSAIAETTVPPAYRHFYYVAFSSLILARTSVANARDVVHSRHHYRRHEVSPNVAAIFRQRVQRMASQMRAFADRLAILGRTYPAKVIEHDARHLPLQAGTIDLVLTSPPYCNALDYTRAHWLAVAWLADILGIAIDAYGHLGRSYIGTDRGALSRRDDFSAGLALPMVAGLVAEIAELDAKKAAVVRHYFADMWQLLREIGRVLRPGGHAALVVCPSNIRKIPIPTHEAFVQMASTLRLPGGHALAPVFTRARTISDYRRVMPYIGMEERMRTEYVLVFEKVKAPRVR